MIAVTNKRKVQTRMNLTMKFRILLILTIALLVLSLIFREYAERVQAIETITIIVTGILIVTGVYLQGFEEGTKCLEKIRKNKDR